MRNPDSYKPPGFMLAFFRWFCKAGLQEDIEGYLLERFRYRLEIMDHRKAKWLFIKDVLLLFRPGIIRSFKNQSLQNFLNMKRNQWVSMLLISLLFVAIIIAPFLPGPPNALVIGVSVFGQLAGFFGLLLIPIGIVWAIFEINKYRSPTIGSKGWVVAYVSAIVAYIIVAVVYLLLALVAFHASGLMTGLLLILVGIFLSGIVIKEIRKLKTGTAGKFNSTPFYFILIPVISFLVNNYVLHALPDYSRDLAIKKTGKLIANIEDFKSKKGYYPESIAEIETYYNTKMPDPPVMGISKYRYNKVNDSYTISFSQWLEFGSLEEIVLYDKNNVRNNLQGRYAVYDYNFDLCRIKAAFESHAINNGEWRYYWLD